MAWARRCRNGPSSSTRRRVRSPAGASAEGLSVETGLSVITSLLETGGQASRVGAISLSLRLVGVCQRATRPLNRNLSATLASIGEADLGAGPRQEGLGDEDPQSHMF